MQQPPAENKKRAESSTVGPGTDLDATEGADVLESETEASEADAAQREDLQDEDIISLDGSD